MCAYMNVWMCEYVSVWICPLQCHLSLNMFEYVQAPPERPEFILPWSHSGWTGFGWRALSAKWMFWWREMASSFSVLLPRISVTFCEIWKFRFREKGAKPFAWTGLGWRALFEYWLWNLDVPVTKTFVIITCFVVTVFGSWNLIVSVRRNVFKGLGSHGFRVFSGIWMLLRWPPKQNMLLHCRCLLVAVKSVYFPLS